ncbi:hypothetical protein HMPREF9444_01382 [Succinatimonas hippei YIT 12066]|uniref:Uncharacterized protein n=1 Tax=Succinatimonas hippei (strain DSM 22608 / JCM 16073 / KCTC 15190 / YIT 12066) TaxID=762983 RepID=E8LKY3_SUCHY|nr:hypothetical protein HMPREF9444_01382 [Succinatimonas hippei YIT 12066]
MGAGALAVVAALSPHPNKRAHESSAAPSTLNFIKKSLASYTVFEGIARSALHFLEGFLFCPAKPQEAVQEAQVRPSKIALASPSLKSFFLCTRKPKAKHPTKTTKKIKETK